MHICKKCGCPIYNADRGNIAIAVPKGYEHINCENAFAKSVIKAEVPKAEDMIKKVEEPVYEKYVYKSPEEEETEEE